VRNPRVKTIGSIASMKFGVLLEPDYDVRNDRELYAAVKGYGKAVVITEFEGTVTMSPERFEAEWRGD
jgi:hypothetical protein